MSMTVENTDRSERLYPSRKSPTIARIYSQDDSKKAKDVILLHQKVVSAASLEFNNHFRGGAKISVANLTKIAYAIQTQLAPHANEFVDHHMDRSGLRRVTKQTFAIQNLLVQGLHGDRPEHEGLYTLIAVTISANRRGGLISIVPTRFRWTAHAISRAYERSELKINNVHLTIAKRISEMYPLISALVSESKQGGALSIPLGRGLLAGDIENSDFDYNDPLEIPHGDTRGFSDDLLRMMYQSNLAYLINGKNNRFTWTARTFVGPSELKREQEAYIHAFTKVQDSLPKFSIREMLSKGIRSADRPDPRCITVDDRTRDMILAATPDLLRRMDRMREARLYLIASKGKTLV